MDALAQGIGYFFIYLVLIVVAVIVIIAIYIWIHDKNQKEQDETVTRIREGLKDLSDEVLQQQYDEVRANRPVSDSIRARRYYKAELLAYGQEVAARHKWVPQA